MIDDVFRYNGIMSSTLWFGSVSEVYPTMWTKKVSGQFTPAKTVADCHGKIITQHFTFALGWSIGSKRK